MLILAYTKKRCLMRTYTIKTSNIYKIVIVFILYLISNNMIVSYWYHELAGPMKSMVFLSYLLLGFLSIYVTIQSVPKIMAIILGILACISTTVGISLGNISRMDLTPASATWLVSEIDQFHNAMSEFNSSIGKALAIGGLSWFLFVFISRGSNKLLYFEQMKSRLVSLVVLFLFLLFHCIAGAYSPRGLAETSLYVYGIPALFKIPPKPSEVYLTPKISLQVEKVVLVVDESVRPDYFNKILCGQLIGNNYIDYGTCNSTANCSAASNSFLRWGLNPDEIGKAGYDPRGNATIWKFAFRAGYHTVLIDGQTHGKPQNLIRTDELKLIDEFIPADVGIDSDAEIAKMLIKRLQKPGKEFYFVVKRGVHWPYQSNYPDAWDKRYTSREERYKHALQYSTGQFINILLQYGVPANAVILYTSDHGQQFSRDGGTHCRGDYLTEEYQVPIVVFAGASTVLNVFKCNSKSWINHASHVQIHSTALTLMGYDSEEVKKSRFTPLTLSCPKKIEHTKYEGSLPFPISSKQILHFTGY